MTSRKRPKYRDSKKMSGYQGLGVDGGEDRVGRWSTGDFQEGEAILYRYCDSRYITFANLSKHTELYSTKSEP